MTARIVPFEPNSQSSRQLPANSEPVNAIPNDCPTGSLPNSDAREVLRRLFPGTLAAIEAGRL